MPVYGYSIDPPEATTEETVANQTTAIKAILDRLMWLRRRFASLLDQTAEPDDIDMEDVIRNTEREA